MPNIHRRAAMSILSAALLAACAGVPLASIPRLMSLQRELDADPGRFMLAVQTDARMVPPPGAVPTLHTEIRPRDPGAFEPVVRTLPMQLTVASVPAGLPPAGAGRRWLLYSLGAASAGELKHIQATFRAIKPKHAGSLSVGIAQDGLAADDPRLVDSVWQSYLRTSADDGFLALWSGTLGDLKAQARRSAAP